MKAIYLPDPEATTAQLTPDSAVLLRGNPWFIPDDGDPALWQARLCVGAVIARLGMHIPRQFAHRYYTNLTVAAHPANDTATTAMEWMRDGALAKGCDFPIPADGQLTFVNTLTADTCVVDAAEMRDTFDRAIATISQFITIKTGDIVMVPLPLPHVPLQEHTDFRITVNNEEVLTFKTR